MLEPLLATMFPETRYRFKADFFLERGVGGARLEDYKTRAFLLKSRS